MSSELRPTEWKDYRRVVEIFLDWPIDNNGPCTPDRTRLHMVKWMQQFHSYVWVVDDEVMGVINCNYDYTEITHAAIHPLHRGLGYFNQMTEALASHLINNGVREMAFDALDQASFIADKYHREHTRMGETGPIHHAKVLADDFAI